MEKNSLSKYKSYKLSAVEVFPKYIYMETVDNLAIFFTLVKDLWWNNVVGLWAAMLFFCAVNFLWAVMLYFW